MVMDYRAQLIAPAGANNTNLPNTGMNTTIPDGAVWGLAASSQQLIQVNDGVVATEAATVLPIDINWGTALSNNNTAGASVLLASAVAAASTNYQQDSSAPISIGQGQIARIHSGNGTTATTGVVLQISSTSGANSITPVTVTSDTGILFSSVQLLASRRILVVWVNGSNVVKFAIHNADGSVFLAATTVATAASSLGAGSFGVAVLAGGNFVICYQKVTSLNASATIYSSAGVIVGSEVTVEAGATPTSGAVIACANGDWVWHYYRSAATTGQKIARFNSTGTVVTAATVVVATSSQLNASSQFNANSIVELPNGNFALLAAASGSTQPTVYTVSSSLALVATYNIAAANGTTAQLPAIDRTPNGGFAVVTQLAAGSFAWLMTFDSSGRLLIGPVSFALTTAGSTGGNMSGRLFSIGSAGFVYACCNYDGATNSVMQVVTISAVGVIKGSLVVVLTSAFSTGPYRWSAALINNSFLHILFADASVNVRQAMYKVMLSSFLGVAITQGSTQVPALISTKGSYRINQNVTAGGAVDGRSNTVAGTRGVIAGPSVYMAGLI